MKASLVFSCPFCRKPTLKTDEEIERLTMKTVEANDPYSLTRKGIMLHKEGDYMGAFEHLKKAAEFGDAEAHYQLSTINFVSFRAWR